MHLTRSLITALATLAMAATLASAQSMSPSAPPGSTGTAPGGGGGGAPVDTDLDLPIEGPVYPPPAPTPTSIPDDRDDPRDEPPPVIFGEEIVSENDTIFYVIDISGSMSIGREAYTTLEGATSTGTRMERAKTELLRSILGLSRSFSFNIVAYDCGTRLWSQEMKRATDGNKASASAWVGALQPTGATGTGPACALALGDKRNMAVVLLTDGAPNCGASGVEGHRAMIRDANTQGATITVFGIAASGTYRQFCVNVAGDSGGSYYDVP
ncbi:MAG: VWA domain-containing protein [Planctomycetes bacterium]|nr:VWA domain-containing protein [Planctomycetota bacterium]